MSDTHEHAPSARGRFLVLEGIDGSGTTTQLSSLKSHFEETGRKAIFTAEPSDGPVGMLIRLALQKRLVGANFDFQDDADRIPHGGEGFDLAALALLFAADRADHVATQVHPNLVKGRHVVCDRYLLSTLAYQGLHSNDDWLVQINRPALAPDLTLFLDLPAEAAAERMRRARWRKDLYESEQHQRVIRERYLKLIDRKIPAVGPVVVIDASRPADEVTRRVTTLVDTFLATGRVEEAGGGGAQARLA
jgi:dTMP kinase